MPFLLIIVGLILAVVAIRNSQGELFNLLKTDLGDATFFAWMGAIIAIGLLGYIPKMQTPSRLLLGLVILVLLLSQQGIFAKLADVFMHPPQPTTPPEPVTKPLGKFPVQLTIQAGTTGGGLLGSLGSLLGGGGDSGAGSAATDVLGGSATGTGFGGGAI